MQVDHRLAHLSRSSAAMDPFEIRMYFLDHLKALNAYVQTYIFASLLKFAFHQLSTVNQQGRPLCSQEFPEMW